MSTAEVTQEADGEEEREELGWMGQQPTSAITGTFEGLIYAGSLNEDVEQNGTSFGVILGSPEIRDGTLFVNERKPDDDLVRSTLEDGETAPNDYRLVDPEDDAAQVREGVLFTKEQNGGSYVETDEIAEDSVIVWYNGVAGGRIGRVLDFNGLPFAEWKEGEEPYLLKGLIQVADGWRDTSRRSELSQEGRGPRVARYPIEREDVHGEQITIEIARPDRGRYYEAHVYEGDTTDEDSELEMIYDEEADDTIEEVGARMALYHGEGWDDRPANVPPSFNIQVEGNSDDPLSVTQRAFVTEVSGALEQYGQTPETAFDGGLQGLMERHGVDGDVDVIRREVYEAAGHLDPSDVSE